MTSYKQLVRPNLNQQSGAGWCLFFARSAFGVPEYSARATQAANKTKFRHATRKMPNVAVPVWFWHQGTYGEGYGEYGHVVIWVPGRGFLSSPGYGYGQEWLSSLSAVEARFNCRFRFWSEDMAGIRLVQPTGKPNPTPPKPKKKGLTVKHYHRKDKDARSRGRKVAAGKSLYLNTKSGGPSNAANIIGGVGPYAITTHVYATGTAGDALDVALVWQNTKSKKNSLHYTQRLVFDRNGRIADSTTFHRPVAKGFRVFARVSAPSTNKGTANITVLDSDAYLIQ